MNKPISRLILCLALALFGSFNNSYLHGQTVQQITSGESQQYDSNYEQPFTIGGIGHYSSYIDDKVMIFDMDSNDKIYETSFDLCEEGVIGWFFNDNEVLYANYQGIIIENIFDYTKEVYLQEDFQDTYLYTSLRVTFYKGILTFNFFPGSDKLNFDVANRRFLDDLLANQQFTTNDFFYHSTGFWGDGQFIRLNRSTYLSDTLFSNYTPEGIVKSNDKFYLLTTENPILVVDKNDNVQSYEFEHERISSGVETSTGRLILTEGINGGTILYELDVTTSNLVRKDTILSQDNIEIVDSYQDRIYVKFNSQFNSYFGYMDYPYLEKEVFTGNLPTLAKSYKSSSDEILIINRSDSEYLEKISVVEKSTGEIEEFEFETSPLWLDDKIEFLSTADGVRFIVSEESGRVIYKYDVSTNAVLFVNKIENKRGLGTSIKKNGDSYLLVDEHNLQSEFEYIHPETKELVSHQVDGTIYGDVIPFNGNFYYARNQDHQGLDEDYFFDYVMFDPMTGIIDLLEEDHFVPKNTTFFYNIIHPQLRFGFVKFNNISLLFDLWKNEKITPDPEIRELIDKIYFESDNYLYAYTGPPAKVNVRIDKNNLENQQVIYEDDNRKILPFDDNSFVAIYDAEAYFVEENEVTKILAPENFLSTFAVIVDNKLMLRGFADSITYLKIYDLITEEKINFEVEGIAIDIVGDYIISLDQLSSPYEFISTHLISGNAYKKNSIEPYSRIFSTDTSIYILNRELKEISVLSLQWEDIDVINLDIPDNSLLNLISKPNSWPLLFKTQVIKSESVNRNNLDYSLLLLDPSTNEIVNYFECGSDFQFNKEFEIGPTSIMLLRTKDEGYQIHKVNFPGFDSVAADEFKDEDLNRIKVNPNPTNSFVTIDVKYDNGLLYNSMGILIDQFQNKKVINLEDYPDGLYHLKIITKDDKILTAKIVKH